MELGQGSICSEPTSRLASLPPHVSPAVLPVGVLGVLSVAAAQPRGIPCSSHDLPTPSHFHAKRLSVVLVAHTPSLLLPLAGCT